jgi:hypothetical protein
MSAGAAWAAGVEKMRLRVKPAVSRTLREKILG